MPIQICFKIEVSQNSSSYYLPSIRTFSSGFNDQASSDFIVVCEEKSFFLHKNILMHRSNYFAAALQHPDIYEIFENKLDIKNYKSDVVEIMLRYIYNDSFCLSDFFNAKNIIDIMKIAQEYYFTDLFNTLDTVCAQHYLFPSHLLFPEHYNSTECTVKLTYFYEHAVEIVEKTGAQKLAAVIWHHRYGDSRYESF